MRPFALSVLLYLTACRPSPPAPAAPVMPDVVQLVPDTAPFRLAHHVQVEHSVGDRPVAGAMSRQAWITVRIAPGEQGVTPTWVLDSAAALELPRDFTPRMIFEREPADLDRELRSLLPRIPTGGARPGSSWTDSTSHEERMDGMTVTWSTVSRRHVSAWTTWAGAPALEIVSRSDYTVTGDGTHAGHPVALTGTGRRHVRHYLSPAGRLLSAIAADTAALDVQLVATGRAIPARQWSADTLEARR